MNGTRPQVEKVSLTDAEQHYFTPIWERFQTAQTELNSVVDLFSASHTDERTGSGWQLAKDGFVRVAQPQSYSNGNGHYEAQQVEVMAQE
jgi:hypothetical protein